MFRTGVEAAGAEGEGAGAGARRVEPVVAVLPPQAHDAEHGPVALLGVRAAPQNSVHELAGRGTGLLGPADEPRRRPLGVGAVGARHVLGDGGRLPIVASPVRRHAAAFEEDLDGRGGVADLDLLAEEVHGQPPNPSHPVQSEPRGGAQARRFVLSLDFGSHHMADDNLKSELDRLKAPGAGCPGIEQNQPGVLAALQALVDPLTHGDPTSPLWWTCKRSPNAMDTGLLQTNACFALQLLKPPTVLRSPPPRVDSLTTSHGEGS